MGRHCRSERTGWGLLGLKGQCGWHGTGDAARGVQAARGVTRTGRGIRTAPGVIEDSTMRSQDTMAGIGGASRGGERAGRCG
jgi:hypothetical protein